MYVLENRSVLPVGGGVEPGFGRENLRGGKREEEKKMELKLKIEGKWKVKR
jgi:hypothetical protein